jgi:thiol-disulfide isomerase/thioredoxin
MVLQFLFIFAANIADRKMKNSIVITILATLTLAACTSTPKSYRVVGVVPDDSYNGKMVYLYDYATRETIDSTLVTGRKFMFTGTASTAMVSRLAIERLDAVLILENGKISVDMADPESAKGTPLNNELSKYLNELAVFEAERMARYTEIAQSEEATRQIRYIEAYDQYVAQVEPLYSKYFDANKNNALGAYVLLNWSELLDPDRLDSLYAQAGDAVRQFAPLQRAISVNANARKTAVGMIFTDFTIENGNIDGSKASLSDYVGKGKYVLVDFWASWCGPCIADIPTLVEVYDTYKGDKFELLGVAVWDKREDTLGFIESHGSPWPQLIDTNDIPTDLYGIKGIPHIILFDPDGKIVARNLRGDGLKAKVAEVMQ